MLKKNTLNFIGILSIILVFSACNATKKGCGLTSDIQKIEQTTTLQTTIVATAK